MKLQKIHKGNYYHRLEKHHRPWQGNYLAMYSSLWDGVTGDPDLMVIPVDDHVVHRGDGVFDVMRCIQGSIYQLEEHLQRLERSAKAISLVMPKAYSSVREIIKSVVRVGGKKNCVIRVTVSRGPGSFSTNPYECPSSHLYVNVNRYRALPDEYYKKGIHIITSHIPIKKAFFATIKSCNYLPNVLMKMEAINAGCQYSVALDEEGFLAEGSTENIGVVTKDGVLKFPGIERTLSGITAARICQLAHDLIGRNEINDVIFDHISVEEAYQAKEVFFTGTSLDILPVVRFDRRPIGHGTPGPVYTGLSSLLREDMTKNSRLLTKIEWE